MDDTIRKDPDTGTRKKNKNIMAAPQSAQQEGNAAFYDDDIDSLEGSDVEISYAQGAGAADYPQGYDEGG